VPEVPRCNRDPATDPERINQSGRRFGSWTYRGRGKCPIDARHRVTGRRWALLPGPTCRNPVKQLNIDAMPDGKDLSYRDLSYRSDDPGFRQPGRVCKAGRDPRVSR